MNIKVTVEADIPVEEIVFLKTEFDNHNREEFRMYRIRKFCAVCDKPLSLEEQLQNARPEVFHFCCDAHKSHSKDLNIQPARESYHRSK
ncbi:MAG TPA: hypothetical protein VEB40_01030 [Flavipsychrobacter sp.]|nr:hypothetical protein [Flavipsychrobacter sp.]